MAKFYGKVGYVKPVEDPPGSGIWTDADPDEFYYHGDVLPSKKVSYQSGDKINDNVSINNQISIIADERALLGFAFIRYVEWMGVKWKVDAIEVARPRLILSLGGVWNGA